MHFKLAVYVECPTCHGSGVVKGMFRSFVYCKGYNCSNGYVTVFVTLEEMNSLLGGETTIDGDSRSLSVKPLRTASGRPIPGRA